MIATAITADAEVRRLRGLGEATHDWCDVCPPAGLPAREPSGTRNRRVLGAALLRVVSRRFPKGAMALTPRR